MFCMQKQETRIGVRQLLVKHYQLAHRIAKAIENLNGPKCRMIGQTIGLIKCLSQIVEETYREYHVKSSQKMNVAVCRCLDDSTALCRGYQEPLLQLELSTGRHQMKSIPFTCELSLTT